MAIAKLEGSLFNRSIEPTLFLLLDFKVQQWTAQIHPTHSYTGLFSGHLSECILSTKTTDPQTENLRLTTYNKN